MSWAKLWEAAAIAVECSANRTCSRDLREGIVHAQVLGSLAVVLAERPRGFALLLLQHHLDAWRPLGEPLVEPRLYGRQVPQAGTMATIAWLVGPLQLVSRDGSAIWGAGGCVNDVPTRLALHAGDVMAPASRRERHFTVLAIDVPAAVERVELCGSFKRSSDQAARSEWCTELAAAMTARV